MANFLPLLLLILLASIDVSKSGDTMVSIDCGSSETYIDENNIPWVGDNLYIQNGQSQVVQASNSVSHVMSTLRVFSTRKKNCYSISADKGTQVLVRASFYYGNYDKKSSPPTFDLHFDANHWSTVVTSIDKLVYYEVIYDTKFDSVSVCVAQTHPNQLPFISAIEVRALNSSMYGHVDAEYALFSRQRTAFGANSSVRFPDDIYDRIWVPEQISNGLTQISSDSAFIDTSVQDEPPSAVLQNAITSKDASHSIVLVTDDLPTVEVPVYLTFYFTELLQLDSTDKRSFKVYIDNKNFSSDLIIPPYLTALELYITNINASANTSISLEATSSSTLPPLINAMEVFQVSDALSNGTNSNDVEALASLQSNFDKLAEWSGDPCLPASFTWEWVACSSDATPRITALYLSGLGLSGLIPDFSEMDALQTIDLHNNSINGEIPDFLGTFTNLKELNLADNALSGPIPTSLTKNNKLKLQVSGNPDLCVSGKSCDSSNTGPTSYGTSGTPTAIGGKKSSKLPVILGSTIPSFVVFWIIVGVVAIFHHKRKAAAIAAIGAGQEQANGGGIGSQPGKIHRPQQATPSSNVHSMVNEVIVEFAHEMASDIPNLVNQFVQDNNNGTDNNNSNNT